jgi:thiamine-monophosphate kinase
MNSERELIDGIRRQALQKLSNGAGRSLSTLRVGIGDDCAVLRPKNQTDLTVTTDFSLENVHFRRDWHPPQSVGHRCLARGLSDLAAMGARPEAAFLSLALPRSLPPSWRRGFFKGLLALAALHSVPLAGGDLAESTSAAGLVLADIVLVGSVPRGRALLRSGARPGDRIYVTGMLGGAALELRALELRGLELRGLAKSPSRLPNRRNMWHPHFYPEPRVDIGRQLMLKRMATAAIDLSDGLSTDLAHLCEESGVHARIFADAIPLAPGATLADALHGGEDYELLFTARPKTKVPAELCGLPIYAIGTIVAAPRKTDPPAPSQQRPKQTSKPTKTTQPRITLVSSAGREQALRPAGWQHFQRT